MASVPDLSPYELQNELTYRDTNADSRTQDQEKAHIAFVSKTNGADLDYTDIMQELNYRQYVKDKRAMHVDLQTDHNSFIGKLAKATPQTSPQSTETKPPAAASPSGNQAAVNKAPLKEEFNAKAPDMPRGPEIGELQKFIAPNTDNEKLKDKIFGPVSLGALEDKLKVMQTQYGLTPNGVYDEATRKALADPTKGNVAPDILKTLDELKAKGKLEHQKTAEPPKAEKKIEDMTYQEAKAAKTASTNAAQAIHAQQEEMFKRDDSILPSTVKLNGKEMSMDTALREHRGEILKVFDDPNSEVREEIKAEIAEWDGLEKEAKGHEAQAQKYDAQIAKRFVQEIPGDITVKANSAPIPNSWVDQIQPVQIR